MQSVKLWMGRTACLCGIELCKHVTHVGPSRQRQIPIVRSYHVITYHYNIYYNHNQSYNHTEILMRPLTKLKRHGQKFLQVCCFSLSPKAAVTEAGHELPSQISTFTLASCTEEFSSATGHAKGRPLTRGIYGCSCCFAYGFLRWCLFLPVLNQRA